MPVAPWVCRTLRQGRTGIPACPPQSKLVEGPLAFDAVELFGFPVDALFDHFETVGGGLKQNPVRAGTEIVRRNGTHGIFSQFAVSTNLLGSISCSPFTDMKANPLGGRVGRRQQQGAYLAV